MPKRPKTRSRRESKIPGREWTRWWDLDAESVAQGLEDRARQLWEDDTVRRTDIERNLRRWGLTLSGLYADPSFKAPEALRVNLTKSLTETITAKVGKNRPRPLVLTDGGHFTNKQRAKKLQRFLDGVYQQADVYEKMPAVFRDAMLMGTGVLGTFGDANGHRFSTPRIFPLELLVDAAAATQGIDAARDLIRIHPEDKDTLIEDHPSMAVEIESAALYGPEGSLPSTTAMHGRHRDMRTAMVCEGWRKARTARDGTFIPGRHVKTINGNTLIDEEWADEDFPFVFHFWSAPIRGPWGDSAVSEIRGMEKEVNILLQRAQEAMHRTGLANVLAHTDSKLKIAKTSDEPMTVVTWEGQFKPEIITNQAVHPQIMQQPEVLMRLAANQLGTNELQISASKPAGIESGRALEQLSEEHAVRFDTISKNFEITMSKKLALALVACAKRMDATIKADGGKGLRLQSTYKKEYIDLNWSDVELGPKEFFLDVFPVSVLPHTPAGRTTEVERWQANKWISADEAKSLLDFPDLESVASVSRASFDLLEWQLEQMLDEGKDVQFDPRQDLELARRFGTHAKLKAQRENYPAEHIALLEDFLTSIDEALAPPPAAPPGGPGMPMPQGDPAAMAAAAGPQQLTPDPMGPGMGATPAALPIQGALQL